MDTDCYGIAHQFEDAFGVLRVTSRDTRDAIRRAMHVGSSPPGRPVVHVIDSRRRASIQLGAGDLRLEDGSTVAVVDRLPSDVPLGYHDFFPRGSGTTVRLIVSPGRCHAPPPKRSWGWAVQLYSLRSRQSWGMGDLADLRLLAEWSRGVGTDFLLVNPLSAIDPLVPQEASPYYPTSRRFRNPLYIRVEEAPGAALLGELLAPLAAAGRRLNESNRVQRDEVFRLKQQALELLWDRFPGDPGFDVFRREMGTPLAQFATYCTLVERFGHDWSKWDTEYRRPEAPGVARFATENARRVEYHQWLQWIIDVQLAHAGALPIVQDMPIGISPRGADAWTWQDVLADGVTVGAPPDMYNTQGQNWGLPPWAPQRLKAARYEPFVQTIRAQLRHAGGLRIDHVMGLFRLFWIPQGVSPVEGTYVEYPAEDLLNIVALESHRARAFIVGEDLGTVGKNVRQMLAAAKILSNRLVWFEEQPPRDYPKLALAAVTTHDLPTVAGLWTGSDLAAQDSLGLRPNVEATHEIRDRLREMTGLPDDAASVQVVQATYELLADAPSALVTATLEDALAVEERPNMPATIDEWPNWRIALPVPLESLVESPLAGAVAASLSGRGKRHVPAHVSPDEGGPGTHSPAVATDLQPAPSKSPDAAPQR